MRVRGLAVVTVCCTAAFLFGCTSSIITPNTSDNLLAPESKPIPLSKLQWLVGTWNVVNPEQNPHFLKPSQLNIAIDPAFPKNVLYVTFTTLNKTSSVSGRIKPTRRADQSHGVLIFNLPEIGLVVKRITNTTAILYDYQNDPAGCNSKFPPISLSQIQIQWPHNSRCYTQVKLNLTKQ